MRQKELLKIEFRYLGINRHGDDWDCKKETITIGIFDTLEEAINEGNKTLDLLSAYFEVRSEDRFKIKHLFGYPKRLVTNTCYPTYGIQYFATITALKFKDLTGAINEALESHEKYKVFRKQEKV